MPANKPIGVFDSGLGGLSVLRELKQQLPAEEYLYVGDSARNPYGPQSASAVIRYGLEAASFLAEAGAKLIVGACTTTDVVALETVRQAYPQMPVVGVVEPGCLAAAAITRGHIALVATQGTVNSGVHAARIAELRPDAKVIGIPAPIFVALAEEGWIEGPIPDSVAERYLGELFADPGTAPDCLLLACTHFPPLQASIRKAVGAETVLVDPAAVTAQHTRAALQERGLLRGKTCSVKSRYCVTADPARFARVSGFFLQTPVISEEVEVVRLG
jgi:glutamate racemase